MKIVIFGADKAGIDFFFEIRANTEVIAFIDNGIEKQGKEILGIRILSADKLLELEYDRIYIASLYHYKDIKCQIKRLGVNENKIRYIPKLVDSLRDNRNKLIDHLHMLQDIYRKEEYEEKWKNIKKNCKDIIIYELIADAIGELISRFLMIENEQEIEGVLRVFILKTDTGSGSRICNKYLIEMFSRKLYIVRGEDASFWEYVLREHLEDIDISDIDRYRFRSYSPYKINDNKWFNNDEEENGKKALRQIGINKPFVCVAARTAAYNQKTIGHDFFYDYKNMNFEDYRVAIKYLQRQNVVAVKMGRMEEAMEPMENCIDYAGLYADDFSDLYLASKCEFMLSSCSGIWLMASLFSKPVLMINAVMFSLGYGGTSYTDRDLYIPKKYFDINKGRYLSLREISEVEELCLIDGRQYEKMGIKFINNTPEEISMATQEMVEKLADKWQDSAEDEKNYRRYMEIYHEMDQRTFNNHDNWLGGPIPFRIATTYLRNNLYLLE